MRKIDTGQDARAPLINTTDAAAARLGVSARTLERWRLLGQGPAYVRCGKRRMYTDLALNEFISKNTVSPEAT